MAIKWEMTCWTVNITSSGGAGGFVKSMLNADYPDPTLIWTRKDAKTGKSEWDNLQKLANEGWELVSVTPVEWPARSGGEGGGTFQIMFTFKRPKEN